MVLLRGEVSPGGHNNLGLVHAAKLKTAKRLSHRNNNEVEDTVETVIGDDGKDVYVSGNHGDAQPSEKSTDATSGPVSLDEIPDNTEAVDVAQGIK
jgi:hypothetical protein